LIGLKCYAEKYQPKTADQNRQIENLTSKTDDCLKSNNKIYQELQFTPKIIKANYCQF